MWAMPQIHQASHPFSRRPANAMIAARRPGLVDSCHAYASDGPIVLRRWPQFHLSDDLDVIFQLPAERRFGAAMELLGIDPARLSDDVGHA